MSTKRDFMALLNKLEYQKTAKLPENGKPKLNPCPWCHTSNAAYIKSGYGIEIQCLNADCKANPMVGFCKGFKNHLEAAIVWNSSNITTKIKTKSEPRNIRSYSDDFLHIHKVDLRNIFINNMVDREAWNKFFPERPYLDF